MLAWHARLTRTISTYVTYNSLKRCAVSPNLRQDGEACSLGFRLRFFDDHRCRLLCAGRQTFVPRHALNTAVFLLGEGEGINERLLPAFQMKQGLCIVVLEVRLAVFFVLEYFAWLCLHGNGYNVKHFCRHLTEACSVHDANDLNPSKEGRGSLGIEIVGVGTTPAFARRAVS